MTADGSSFDAIIVGSGFGGAINAHRLAAAGKRVFSVRQYATLRSLSRCVLVLASLVHHP
jgi:pyruvate/2-oxoglutarate dehydrogenase complex dihydrolipoamide dehydrogenase (E3) component